MRTFRQFYEDNSMEYHYTIIGIGGYHSENIIVLKSFGHVPDQKVEGLVKYSTQLANEQFGEDEDYQGEYEDYVEFGTADAMSNFYHDVGIDEAVGEYHINEQYKLVKHIPPHRGITAGDSNFEGDEMFFIRTLDGWDGSLNEGLWANINAKKKRGGKSAKKGSKAYKAAKKAGDKLEATKESVTSENFKDGKKKGKSRPGRVKRSGASCNGSVSELRKKAKAGGEKGKMYHFCANMKGSKNK